MWHQCKARRMPSTQGRKHRHEILVSSLTRNINPPAVLLGLPAPSVSLDELTPAQAHLPAHHIQNKDSLSIVAIETRDKAAQRSADTAKCAALWAVSRSADTWPAAPRDEILAGQDRVLPLGCPARCSRRWCRGRLALARSKSTQPSRHALLGFSMRNNAALFNGPFAAGNAFEYGQSLIEPLVRLNIDHVGRRTSMLGNQYGNSLAAYL